MIFEYKGISVYYKDLGRGDVILLLHGFLETSVMWQPLTKELSKHNRVISIDLLGHGKTGCLGYVHSMETMANTVLDILKYLDIQSFTAIGHSMGGYVALALADKHPEYFTGLCLMNSTFQEDSDERVAVRRRAIVMAKTNYQNLIRLSFSNLFAPSSKVAFKNEYNKALKIAMNTSLQGYIAAQEGMILRPNRLSVFENLSVKTAVIIGKKDTVIDGEKLQDLLKNTDTTIVEFSGGHMSHIENYTNLLTFIIHFIEK